MPARWLFRASEGMLVKKVVTMASTIFLLQQMEVLPTQGICKEAFLKPRLHTNYGNLFRNKPEVLKLIRPYDQKTFETYDKIEKPFGIHIMR